MCRAWLRLTSGPRRWRRLAARIECPATRLGTRAAPDCGRTQTIPAVWVATGSIPAHGVAVAGQVAAVGGGEDSS
jgi:hypothetical protein